MNELFVTHKVEFQENDFLTKPKVGDSVELEEIQETLNYAQVHACDQQVVEPKQDVEKSRTDKESEGRGGIFKNRIGTLFLVGCDDMVNDESLAYQQAMSGTESDK